MYVCVYVCKHISDVFVYVHISHMCVCVCVCAYISNVCVCVHMAQMYDGGVLKNVFVIYVSSMYMYRCFGRASARYFGQSVFS
jgi:hypothetical protein